VRIHVAAAFGTIAVLATGCGVREHTASGPQRNDISNQAAPAVSHAHPQAVEPVAGAIASAGAAARAGAADAADPGSVSVGPSEPLAQPVSDAEIRRELAASGLSANSTRATLTPSGLAIAPAGAPVVVQQVIAAGNQIAHLPYRFGGGHGTFIDNAYDCSGSLSFVFAAAGIVNTTFTSGELMSWGAPGPGKWITVFANNGHTFMYLAGLRFDTVALAETGSRWSNRAANEPDLATFVVRHPPGL